MFCRLFRLEESLEHGTLGALVVNGAAFCATLELPDRANQANVRRIPADLYTCRRIVSPRFHETFEVTDVPGRSHILFHKGNTDDDTHGCILLGQYWGILGNAQRAVLNSGATFARFMAAVGPVNQFQLEILELFD